MTDPIDVTEIDSLRQQVIELTQRVFRLEQILEGGASASYTHEAVHYPTMQLDNLVEPQSMAQPTTAESASEQIAALSASKAEGSPPATTPGAEPRVPGTPLPAAETAEPGTPLPASLAIEPPPPAPVQSAPAAPQRQIARPTPKPELSLESRVGGQWLNRVGIIAVLVGLSYFLKLAFDNNWIGPPVRVAIGLALGFAVLLWSERFRRRNFAGFAYSLKAVAFGAMYLSLWAAFQFYHLVPAEVAFGVMVGVTVLAAGLSLRQNSELLAAFALVGGFLTPVLVSTGQNQELALLSYLALLDLATLWIVAIKGWPRILMGSLVGTTLLFAGWASAYYSERQLPLTLGFASFFFVLYSTATFLRGVRREQRHFTSLAAAVLLSSAAYLTVSYAMLFELHRQELAYLLAIAAVFLLLLSFAMRRWAALEHPTLPAFYLGLAVLFTTIAIPLGAQDQWITLGWIIEGGVLFWASHYYDRKLLRILGTAVTLLGVVRLIAVDSEATQPLLMNPRLGLYLLAIGAFATLAYLAAHEPEETSRNWAGAAIVAINVLALIAMHFELSNYFEPQLRRTDLSPSAYRAISTVFDFTYSACWTLYGCGLLLAGFWKRSAFVRWQGIILLAATIGKVFLFDISVLERIYRIAAFVGLGAVLLVISFFYQRSRRKPVEA